MFGFVKSFLSPAPEERSPYIETDSEEDAHGVSQDNSGRPSPESLVDRKDGVQGRSETLLYDTDPPESRRRSKKPYQSSEYKKGLSHKEKRKMEDVHRLMEDLKDLESTNKELKRDTKASKVTIQHLNAVIEDMGRVARGREVDLQEAQERTLRLEEQSRRQSEELQMLKNELRQAEARHEQTRHLLEERTRELSGAQKFLTRTDSLSGADVISIVDSLNAEILQAAASIADTLEFTYESSLTEAQKKKEYENAARMIGADMMQVLTSRSTQAPSEFDPTPVQIALQICIVQCCARIADCWVTNNDKLNQGLKEVYRRMCEKEKQAVSGRWRSLTRIQAKNDEHHRALLSYVVGRVTAVLTVAGWSARGPSDREPGFNLERLAVVVDLALRLNAAIGEDITSVDILPVTFLAGVHFDPIIMDDTYAADVGKGNGIDVNMVAAADLVAGTTDLGLQRITRDLDASPHKDILLKPKVILRSAVQEEFLS